MRFGMFFLNEYAGLTIMSMVAVTLFFGGWHGPFDGRDRLLGRLLDAASSGSSSRPTCSCSRWSGSASRSRACRSTSSWPSPGRSSSRSGLRQHPRHRRRSCSGCRSWKWGMAVFSWVALLAFVGLFDPDPQVAPAQAARAPAGGERLMLGMFKAMRTTLRHLPMKKITVQYPEQRERLPERSRGLFRVVIDPPSGEPRCRSCTLCETNCPVQVIRVNYTSKYQLPVPNAARIAEARLAAQPGVDLKAAAAGARRLLRARHRPHRHAAERAGRLRLPAAPGAPGDQPADRRSRCRRSTASSASTTSSASRRWASTSSTSATAPPATWRGRSLITEALEEELGVADGKTTKDMKFTLSSVACMGACSLAPVMRIGETDATAASPLTRRARSSATSWQRSAVRRGERRQTMAERRRLRRPGTEARNVSVAPSAPAAATPSRSAPAPPACFAGSLAVYDAFVQEVQAAGLGDRVEVSIIGCHGLCSMSPVVVLSDDTLYGHLRPKDVAKVVEEHLKGGAPVEKFLYKDAADRRAHPRLARHRLLQAADAHRAARRRRHRPREHRRVPGARRLRGRAHGAHREDARVDHRARSPTRASAAAAAPASPRASSGSSPTSPRATRSTSSATPTRATPARSWTARSSRATRTPSSRA